MDNSDYDFSEELAEDLKKEKMKDFVQGKVQFTHALIKVCDEIKRDNKKLER